jgi:hypothetical protein
VNTHIWCPACEAMRLIKEGQAGAVDVTGSFTNGVDLMCSVCSFVVATTARPVSPQEVSGA